MREELGPPTVSDDPAKSEPVAPAPQGELVLGATVAAQAIQFPTDLSLLNEARELSGQVVDLPHADTEPNRKPWTYRAQARKAYLGTVTRKLPLPLWTAVTQVIYTWRLLRPQ